MAKKIVKTYVYEGLGFPITLHNIEMVLINDEYVPKIDVRLLADQAVKSLVLQKTKLTGSQIKFIRSYFSLSLRDFGEVVNESHTAVSKWEKFNGKSTNMDPNIETRIRIYIYDKMFIKSRVDKSKFYDQYHAITDVVFSQKSVRSGQSKLAA